MTSTRRLAVRIYGLLFRLLILVVPQADELDVTVDLLSGEQDERFL